MFCEKELEVLKLGSISECVIDLRASLESLGYLPSSAGVPMAARLVFDGSVDKAVREFQTRSNINSDGKVGRDTWDALWLAKYKVPIAIGVSILGVAAIIYFGKKHREKIKFSRRTGGSR